MNLSSNIRHYLRLPSPIWNTAITMELVQQKWLDLIAEEKIGSDEKYRTVTMLGNDIVAPSQDLFFEVCSLPVELPDPGLLKKFYEDNELDVLNLEEIGKILAHKKVNAAFSRLLSIEGCGKSVSMLVKALQILRQPEPEFDVSYSHPKIPFTIFVSVGEDTSEIESLRLSESILHESMHLLLSLIEERVPLVTDNECVYYSPWRETLRPLKGVLHGMFVFRAVLDYYRFLLKDNLDNSILDFVEFRIEQITLELLMLKDFAKSKWLTADGASLAAGLLPSN